MHAREREFVVPAKYRVANIGIKLILNKWDTVWGLVSAKSDREKASYFENGNGNWVPINGERFN